ncbi:hypothetical protein KKF84_22300 [Myxococcota bacterium]|nr:hypothetical protein [Myxococcota bacterium]
MEDNRQPIRRNLTGGLSLGLFAGLWLALPEVVQVISHGGKPRLYLGVAALHITFGILGGGVLGLVVGGWAALVSRIVQGEKHRRNLWQWFAFSVMALVMVYPSSQIPLNLPHKAVILGGTLMLAFVVARPVVHVYGRIYSGYTSSLFNLFVSVVLGAVSTACSVAGMRLLRRPFYWEIMALFFAIAGSLLLFLSIRFRRRSQSKKGRGLAILATPTPIVGLLVLAVVLGSLGKHTIEEGHNPSVLALAPIAAAMVSEKPVKQAPGPSETHAAYSGARFRIPASTSLIVITQAGGPPAHLKKAWKNDRVVLPSQNEALVLASLFTGKNYGIRHYLAPHLPVSGPSFISRLSKKGVKWGSFNFSGQYEPIPYFRELPSLGFPPSVPYLLTTDDKLDQLVASFADIRSPFIGWIHARSDLAAKKMHTIESLIAKEKGRVWLLYVQWDGTLTEGMPLGTIQLVGPEKTKHYTHYIPLSAVLPSLFGLGRKGFDVGGRSFPPRPRGIQWVVNGKPFRIHRGKMVEGVLPGLRSRILRSMGDRIVPLSWLAPKRTVQEQIEKLDQLLCKGWLSETEKRKLTAYKKGSRIHPQVDRRVDLLRALTTGGALPEWTKNLAVLKLLKALNMDRDIFSLADDGSDPVTVGWVIYYRTKGLLTKDLLRVCPGAGLAKPPATP